MNTCDLKDIKSNLLNEFYALARKPEQWSKKEGGLVNGSYRLSSYPTTLRSGCFALAFDNIVIEIGNSSAFFRSKFTKAAEKLIYDFWVSYDCQRLEEALKRASQEAKPKKGRKKASGD